MCEWADGECWYNPSYDYSDLPHYPYDDHYPHYPEDDHYPHYPEDDHYPHYPEDDHYPHYPYDDHYPHYPEDDHYPHYPEDDHYPYYSHCDGLSKKKCGKEDGCVYENKMCVEEPHDEHYPHYPEDEHMLVENEHEDESLYDTTRAASERFCEQSGFKKSECNSYSMCEWTDGGCYYSPSYAYSDYPPYTDDHYSYRPDDYTYELSEEEIFCEQSGFKKSECKSYPMCGWEEGRCFFDGMHPSDEQYPHYPEYEGLCDGRNSGCPPDEFCAIECFTEDCPGIPYTSDIYFCQPCMECHYNHDGADVEVSARLRMLSLASSALVCVLRARARASSSAAAA